jgi:putative transposase
MRSRPRADEAGGLYHALHRGNARLAIFRKDADYEAFGEMPGIAVARIALLEKS